MLSKLKRLWYESKIKNKLIFLGFIYLLLGVLSFISSYSIGNITENAISLNTDTMKMSIIFLIISSLLHIIIEWFSNNFKSKINQRVIANFKTKTALSLLKSKFSFNQNLKQGDIIGRINSDISSIVVAMDFSLLMAKSLIFFLILTLSLFFIDYRLLIAFFIPIPFLFFSQYVIANISTKYIIPWKEAMGNTNGLVQDLINNRTTIKSFRLENETMDWLDDSLKKSAKAGIVGIGKLYFITQIPILFIILPIFSLAIVGIYLVTKNYLNLQSLITAFMMAQISIVELNSLQNSIQNIPQLLASTERIFPLWDSPKENSGSVDNIVLDKNKPIIQFENISFSYPSLDKNENEKILNNISFEIKYGEKIGIVGTSGSGKSTIFKLLTGLYEPDSGNIKISGIDIKDIDKSTLRNNISMVTQNSFLFDNSIVGNLKYANKNITEKEIENIIEQANLTEYINSQKDKLNTVIGEKGNKLSGGQRQRLSIARALVRNSPILLLDEATSALDVETEKKIQNTLENIKEEQTQLVIAHRLSTIKNMDKILVLNKGNIVEEGTHEELLNKNNLYTSLYNKQKGDENNGE